MVEFWKLKRELNRLRLQIEAPFSVALSPIARMVHDKTKHRRITLIQGSQSYSNLVAVYLVYSPAGLEGSHIKTIQHLCEQGFAVFVVANHALSLSDRERIAPHSWRMMERPNVGYDFGGYRDVALHLLECDIYPEFLLFLNDSMWFPVKEDCRTIDKVMKLPVDVCGFSEDLQLRSKGKPFIQSFFFGFRANVLRSESYQQFWSRMLLLKNKWAVVRWLEKRLSEFFEQKGFSTAALYGADEIPIIISNLESERQLAFFDTNEAKTIAERGDLQAQIKEGKRFSPQEWAVLFSRANVDGYFLKNSPKFLFEVFDTPMLKKTNNEHFVRQRAEIISAGYDQRLLQEVRQEIRERDAP